LSIYLDASVLIPLFVDDDWTPRVRAWLATQPEVLVSDWTLAEFSSALSLHVRRGRLTPEERDDAENTLNDWVTGLIEVAPVPDEDVILARLALHRHPKLRTPDALHLTIVLRLGHQFASYDEDLIEAARRDGVEVVTP